MKEIRATYKEMDIGVLPVGWEVKRIIDLADKKDRYSYTGGPFGSDLKSSDYTAKGVRVIQLQNIGDGKFNDISKIFTSEEKANELLNSNVFPGDLILAKMADPVARACKIPSYHEKYIMCSDGIRLKVDPLKFDVDYCLFSINSRYFRKQAIENSTGTTRLRIGLTALKELKILVPPLPEQHLIAKNLTAVNDHLEKLNAIIADTQLLKKAMMQSLLTRGIGHTEFKDTVIGQIPKTWEVVELKDIADIKGGKRLPKGHALVDEDSGFPYIRVADMSKGSIDDSDIKYVPVEIEPVIKNYKISKDDLFISVAGTLGIVGSVPEKLDNANLTENANKICNIKCDKNYLMYYLQSQYIQNVISNERTVGAQPKLAIARIQKFNICLPKKNEQHRIAEILFTIDDRLGLYEKEKENFAQLKKGLMEQLLTGKIRVK